jgi:hypothetical protein
VFVIRRMGQFGASLGRGYEYRPNRFRGERGWLSRRRHLPVGRAVSCDRAPLDEHEGPIRAIGPLDLSSLTRSMTIGID